MATTAQVLQRVGEEMGIIRVGGTLRAEDNTRITAAYNEVYERLKKEGLATWASTGDVPTQLVPYFCEMVEEKLLKAYPVSNDRYTRIKMEAGENGAKSILSISGLVNDDFTTTSDGDDF